MKSLSASLGILVAIAVALAPVHAAHPSCTSSPKSRTERLVDALDDAQRWIRETAASLQAEGAQATLLSYASESSESELDLSVRDALALERLLYESVRLENGELSPLLKSILATSDTPETKVEWRAGVGFLVDLDVLDKNPQMREESQALEEALIDALGRKLERLSGDVSLATRPGFWDRPGEVPEGLEPVWDRLVAQYRRGDRPLVEIELDGDPAHRTPLELMSERVLHNAADHADAFRRLRRDARYAHNRLRPWLEEHDPDLAAQLERARAQLLPWWFTDPANTERVVELRGGRIRFVLGSNASHDDAHAIFEHLMSWDTQTLTGLARYTDLVHALGIEPIAAGQTSWLNLLRGLATDERHRLLNQTLEAALVFSRYPSVEPSLKANPRVAVGPYDRGTALRELLTRTFYDLDYEDRDELLATVERYTKRLGTNAEIRGWTKQLQRIRNHRVDFTPLQSAPPPSSPVIVSEYFDAPVTPRMLARPRRQVFDSPLHIHAAFEGGGGKGNAYPGTLALVADVLHEQGLEITSYSGASAGALTSGLLAAGTTPEELASTLGQLDFTEFFHDHVTLMGGLEDPQIRAVDRTGLFSTRSMYQRIDALLRAQLPIPSNRPVFFKDLPSDLQVVVQVAGRGDLPDSLAEQLGVGDDGRLVFSRERTPNAEVAAAMVASATIPGFFHVPQLEVASWETGADGRRHMRTHHFQASDGGAIQNLPVEEPFDAEAMIVVPVYTRADEQTRLTTLNFGPTAETLDAVNQANARRLAPTLRTLPGLLDRLRGKGYPHVTMAFDLVEDPAQRPGGRLIIQGRNRDETRTLLAIADDAGIPHFSAERGAELFEANLLPESSWPGYLSQYVINLLVDGGATDMYKPDIWPFRVRRSKGPAQLRDMDSVLRSVFFGMVVTIGEREDGAHLFETPPQ